MSVKYNFDLGLRHKSGMTANEFIRRYCEVFRPYAYATCDDSLNEFEKLITHCLSMLCYHKRRAELLGLPVDPRESVEAIEDAVSAVTRERYRLAGALLAARGNVPSYAGENIDALLDSIEQEAER